MSTRDSERDEEEIASLLRLSGPRESLPPVLKARWESHVRAELTARESALQERKASRRRLLGLCASVAAVVLGVVLIDGQRRGPVTQLVLVHAVGDYRIETAASVMGVASGQAVPVGSVLGTDAKAYVKLIYNGYDLRLRENSSLELREDLLRLHAGELYVSSTPARDRFRDARDLLIRTVHGSIRDIGTQFTVALDDSGTRATVREGSILVEQEKAEVTVTARDGQARRATLAGTQTIAVTPAPAWGDDWQWIHNADPGFAIDSRSAMDFLRWAARETGLQLRFSSAASERRAQFSILRGNTVVLDPEQALGPVLASSELSATVTPGGELLVRRAVVIDDETH